MGPGPLNQAAPLRIDPSCLCYRFLIGTGGIGSGVFFAVDGNHTLGREESRSGRFLDRRDYCKLHIVAHYVRTLMGPLFTTLPVGQVGDDATGESLLTEMAAAGLDLRYVRVAPGEQTLHAICIVYPDGSGGNLTVHDSASAHVSPAMIRAAEPELEPVRGCGIALAVPEAPLAARMALLDLAMSYGFLRAASIASGEISAAREAGMLRQVDVLALNVDEAATLAGVPPNRPPDELARLAAGAAQREQPAILLSVTAGSHGSWTWDGQELLHIPAHTVDVAGTAGAGDAHLSGLLAGLAAGLTLSEAHHLAVLVAARSVMCPHTIDKGLDRLSLRSLAETVRAPLCAAVWKLLT